MTKKKDSEHHMETRSKNKKTEKKNKKETTIKPKKKITKKDDNDDLDNLIEFILLLEKIKKEHELKDEDYISDNDIIIEDDEESDFFKNYEQELLNENTNKESFKIKILKSNLNDDVKRTIIKNINYLNTLNEYSSEYQKMYTWIKNMEKIPFDNFIKLPVSYKSSTNSICKFLESLQKQLNNCIYGQYKAKESILQIVTQIITNPQSKGSIIALKGPPGVGKTSLIKNGLAKILNLPFSFITLGGITDSSYFEGFSYTYEGSKYGKICEILIKTGCMNPIIFMDELDKISTTHRGDDINNFLVHLTDFTQNDIFEDKYFSGIPLDLSKAIFIFSLNDETKINPILKDRLNIIHLEEFKINEKVRIGKEYLIPELIKNIGIKEEIIFTDKNIEYIIKNYCPNESGVRELKRCIETIIRRINVYKYSKNIKLNYDLKKLKFPINITDVIIDILLEDKKNNLNKTSNLMMYL